MKNLGLLFISGLMMFSCNEIPKTASNMNQEKESVVLAEPVKDGMLIHITKGYDDPHRVLMALKMATMMAVDKDVLVYMDIDAVGLLVKEAKDLNHPGFESAHTYIKQLVEKNVGVYACPTCIKVAGFTPGDLMEGVQAAQKDKFFDFTKGRIITLDY
ncbi:DsrE family protein [Maribacter polysiphoniae]|nr:DsrE family protein [Maribacter polysiphoniae]PWK23996.1 putative peroxiredoxin [Maribacter polysiphoniae]